MKINKIKQGPLSLRALSQHEDGSELSTPLPHRTKLCKGSEELEPPAIRSDARTKGSNFQEQAQKWIITNIPVKPP